MPENGSNTVGKCKKPATEEVDTPRKREERAEEILRKKRLRLAQQAKLASFLENISAQNVNRVLNQFTVEIIAIFLSQLPELPDLLNEWSTAYFASLSAYRISEDVTRLDKLGVKPEAVSVAMRAIKISPFVDKSFASLGNKRQRNQLARRLTSPVQDLRRLAAMSGTQSALIWEAIPNPSIIASELELLSSMLNWGHIIYDFFGANHLLEVSKFALSSLVNETTGMFLDREVSNLICVALDNPDYDETRHRVWRADNYKRLQQNIPVVTRILLAINSVVPAHSQGT